MRSTAIDLTAPEVVADPYPFCAEERRLGAVAWHEQSGSYLTFDHAAANAVLEALPGFLLRAVELGKTLRSRLEAIAPDGADVRGLGPMLALELPDQSPERAATVAATPRERGLVLLACGLYGNVIRLHVPFVVTDEQLDAGLAILEASLAS